ncbi:hypothetical protein QO009_002024 [Brevibacillus aydinogluensis]|uniref:hypothetical protein n=1 Tax=Brevibacillus aydinogluensis TaxID=927786 RepID=UPI00289340BC|nr:hypothetical protein [Brevibacillus aydinogluensis]MDT3416156.1 hypothetical protein [Brevibacillus aydinogluensis]
MQYKTEFKHGKTTYHLDYAVGDTVEWTSQAAGISKSKRGKVVAIIKPGEDAFMKTPPGTFRTQLKGQRYSLIPRALVEVPRGGQSAKCDYYTPHVNWPRLVKGE